MTLKQMAFGNNVGKGENVGSQHSFPFLNFFLPFAKQVSFFHSCLYCLRQMFLSFGKDFNTLSKTSPGFYMPAVPVCLENTEGKRRNCS